MKILAWLLGFVVFLFTITYGILFSSYGNAFLKPIIEKEVLKQTHLDSKLVTFQLSANAFEIYLLLNTNNTLHLYGNYSQFSGEFNINYVVDLKELSTLEPLINKRLNGTSYLEGNIVGDLSSMSVDGMSTIAYGDTKYTLQINDFKLVSFHSSTKNLDLVTLALLLGEVPYIDAKLNIDANFANLQKHALDGTLKINTSKALFNSVLTKKYFNKSLPNGTAFKLKTSSVFKGDDVLSQLIFDAKIFQLQADELKYNLKTEILSSDYAFQVPSLKKLAFLTAKDIKGDLSVEGALKYDKDLELSMHSNIAGGKIDATLRKNKLHASLKSINTLEALDRFYYPKILKGTLDAQLDYDISKSRGMFKSKITKGVFSQNKLFKLIQDYTSLNMYKEVFNGTLYSKINRTNFLIDLDLFSDNASIETKKAKLNTRSKSIDALVSLEANSNVIDVSLRGDIAQPKIELHIQNLMIKKLLDKYLK